MGDQPYPGLEVDEDMRVKRWSLTGEAIQYLMLALLIGAALMGFFGPGPMSKVDARSRSGGMQMEYERYQRLSHPAIFRVDVSADSSISKIEVDGALLDDWQLESITPQPSATRTIDGSVSYAFSIAEASRLRVVFRLVPERAGRKRLRFTSGSESITARVFVYP